jgi:hypothetical protein
MRKEVWLIGLVVVLAVGFYFVSEISLAPGFYDSSSGKFTQKGSNLRGLIEPSQCDPAEWQCDGNFKINRDVNCRVVAREYCEFGCEDGECQDQVICGDNVFDPASEGCEIGPDFEFGTDDDFTNGVTCIDGGFDYGILRCEPGCQAFDTSNCAYFCVSDLDCDAGEECDMQSGFCVPASQGDCGNGEIDDGETCDDGNPACVDCQILPFSTDFTIEPNPGEISSPITFTSLAHPLGNDLNDPTDDVLAYLWTFSEGGGGYGQSVTKSFNGGGTYTASVLIIKGDGSSHDSGPVPFEIDPGLSVLGVVWESSLNMPRGFAHVKNEDGVGASQSIVWAAGDPVTLATADVSDPNAPFFLNETTVPGGPWDLAANNDIVAVGATWRGVNLYDASQPNNLVPIATIDTYDIDSTYAFDVALSEDLLFVASGVNLMVFDVSDPMNPVTRLVTRDYPALQVEVLNGFLFAYGGSFAGYRIYNFSGFHSDDPGAELLVEVGQVPTSAMPLDVTIDDHHMAIAEGINGLELFRLPTANESSSGSYQPVFVTNRSYIGDGVRGVHLRGDYLYVAQGSRIEKLRITSSDTLQSIQWVGMSSWVYDLRGDEDTLYQAIGHGVVATLKP